MQAYRQTHIQTHISIHRKAYMYREKDRDNMLNADDGFPLQYYSVKLLSLSLFCNFSNHIFPFLMYAFCYVVLITLLTT